MSEEEPDYMSDDFLKACTAAGDVRPGLQYKRETERLHQLERRRAEAHERHRQKHRPKHVIEAENRQQALDTPIDSSNKGFALLKMMGYKPGTAIGKQGSQGIVEPIRPEPKSDRAGLGREAALRAVQRRKEQIRAARASALRAEGATSAAQFRQRLRDKMADRYLAADLMKSQRVCEQLDTKMGVTEPFDSWFWPPVPAAEDDEAASQDDQSEDVSEAEPVPFSPSEQLEMLTEYLRRSHLYCIWCGCQFNDEDDLKESCPGSTRDDH